MKKIVRILGLIQIIRQKKYYSGAIRLHLIFKLLFLEYKSITSKNNQGEIKFKFLNYTVNAIGYENLRILFTEIFIHEEYQYFTTIQPGSIIADCGANIGMATLYLKMKFPDSIIHAFEPDYTTFNLLERNVKQNNLKSVILHNEAIMDRNDKLNFYISDLPASLMMSAKHERMSTHKIEVQGVDFSQFIYEVKPVAVKIDVEGAELDVFKKLDATNVLNHVKEIVMEYHHRINGDKSQLSQMLLIFEHNGFEYSIHSQIPTNSEFQDILIYAFKP